MTEQKGEYKGVLATGFFDRKDGEVENSSITVEDACELRMQLEQRISEMVREFEDRTNLDVVAVDLCFSEDEGTYVEVRALL